MIPDQPRKDIYFRYLFIFTSISSKVTQRDILFPDLPQRLWMQLRRESSGQCFSKFNGHFSLVGSD